MNEIVSWRIQNFKSLLDVNLHFPQLTVLAGTNSAGKSSILQSLLVLAQSGRGSESIILNGPLTRLGLPDDVVRSSASSIFVDYVVAASVLETVDLDISPLSVSIVLEPRKDANQLSAVSFRVADVDQNILIEATNRRVSTKDETAIREEYSEGSSVLRVSTIDGSPAASRMYLVINGFYPTALVVHKSTRDRLLSYSKFFSRVRAEKEIRWNRLAPHRLVPIFSNPDTREEIARKLGSSISSGLSRPSVLLKTIRDISESDVEELTKIFVDTRADGEFAFLGIDNGLYGSDLGTRRRSMLDPVNSDTQEMYSTLMRTLSVAADELDFFSRSIRYLGPLREEPRVLNNSWDQRTQSVPVGVRGELSAEILASERSYLVDFCDWDGVPYTETLPTAVGMWAKYLGIGEEVSVLDEGKLGRGVKLRVNGELRDLTTIGVGASQLLPVLVACLSVRRGSTMLVEQPELHLHPAVQSKLADFFLFARTDINIIVETHSEYLVTRIRRRVAEDKVNVNSVTFLFAEQESGRTSMRTLTLDEYGDLDVWPRGFFDAQDLESREIVRAISSRIGGKDSNG